MSTKAHPVAFLFLFLVCTAAAQAQQPAAAASPNLGAVVLNVVVTPKNGPPVSDLQQQDFTILDNKASQPISSFAVVDGRKAPIEVIVVIDSVNIGYQDVARQREGIDRFLRTDGGHLAYLTTFAVATDKGMELQQDFSQDGNAVSAALDQSDIGLRSIGRSAGFYGANERFETSLRSLQQLVAHEASKPLRKVILWVSPGWPLLSGVGVQSQLDNKQEQQIFDEIVNFSTLLRQARVTLYSVDPLGTADIGMRTSYWESFLKGVSKPSQAQPGDLGLQVLATQSGGQALNSSNDIAAQLQKCMQDTGGYYEISFDPPRGDQPHEYHHLEVKLARKGLTARTIEGYYSQP